MAKRIKDTDYLAISARIRAMENGLLTRERMEQVLEAHTGEEAAKILQECGYPALDPARPEEMDAALAAVREETLADLADSAPDARYIDIFKLKYDYHNVKALLKAAARGTDPGHILLDTGRTIISGVASVGMPRASSAGAHRPVSHSRAPEARNMATAVSSPTRAGRTFSSTVSPSSAPWVRAPYTSTRRPMP